jgi:hypothetical protein
MELAHLERAQQLPVVVHPRANHHPVAQKYPQTVVVEVLRAILALDPPLELVVLSMDIVVQHLDTVDRVVKTASGHVLLATAPVALVLVVVVLVAAVLAVVLAVVLAPVHLSPMMVVVEVLPGLPA